MINNITNNLINEALKAQKNAICPYSNYPVGAAILTDDYNIISGFNIESKAYPTTLCAERVAIFSAIAQGYNKFPNPEPPTLTMKKSKLPSLGYMRIIYI